jgi:hypothetical protein
MLRLHDRPVREGQLQEKKRKPVVAEMKARQAAKIRELGHALVDAGFLMLDEQSKALGLARSTTWTVLRASHKGSGLSAAIIKRMLLSPQLPPLARRKILEYTTDKLAGVYGGSRTQRLRFFERLKRATAEKRACPPCGRRHKPANVRRHKPANVEAPERLGVLLATVPGVATHCEDQLAGPLPAAGCEW